MKNVLFLVTGMTPQIITETLWALACDPTNEEQWIPDEIQVLSTEYGLNQIKSRLFKDNIFKDMQRDYPQLVNTKFDEESLIAIADEEQTYTDIKTPHDNEVMADVLCSTIRNLCKEDITLHVSIAGGRKTMGFYAGYALSLYGRAQDRLSHVLVEEKYEKAVNFFYPALEADKHFSKDRDNKIIGDSAKAQIWLADIPFVRMKQAIKDKHQLKSDDSFNEVVNKINESFNDVHLKINVHHKNVVVNNKFTISNLPAREFALLNWFAYRRKNELGGIYAPKENINSKTLSSDGMQYIQKLTNEFTGYYQDLKQTEDFEISVDKKFFEGSKSRLKSELGKALGLELANNIEITQNGRGKPFYLNIAPDSIELIDTFKD